MRGARLRHTVRNKGMLIALFGHLLFRHVFSTCQTPKFFRLPGLAVPNSLSPASTVDSVRRAGSNSPPRVIFDSTGSYAAAAVGDRLSLELPSTAVQEEGIASVVI